MQDKKINTAYETCLRLARQHYENFPTASRIVSKKHRNATAAIYSFARRADDIADEGNLSDEERLRQLEDFSSRLSEIKNNSEPDDPTFIALADTIKRYQLPLLPFENLLTAFKMDVRKKRFASFDELLYYCEHSANPVGELVLRIHDKHNKTTRSLSDQICTALQLINFLQDINCDFVERNRIYIPHDEMENYGVSEHDIESKTNQLNLTQLVNFQLDRAATMLLSGSALVKHLDGRLKWVIKLTINSALLVCEKLSVRNDIFSRPVLKPLDWLKVILKTIYFRPDRTHAKILFNINNRTPSQ